MSRQTLSLKVKLGYGVCDLGGNLFFTVIAFMLPIFLTDTVGLAAGMVGVVLLLGKVWDAVTDPTVGSMSDRTQSRWGRRRPWLLFGSVPLFVGMWLMFTDLGIRSAGPLFAWTLFVYCFLCTAFTVVNIPYSALTPELTRDFDERTVLNGYRMAFAVVGSLLGAGAALPLVNAFGDRTVGFSVMGALFGAVMMITALVTFFAVQEPEPGPIPPREPVLEMVRTWASAFRNRPFVFLLVAWACHTTGVTILAGSVTYYYKYVFHVEHLATVAMLFLLVTALVAIPVWVRLSERFGKKACSISGMGLLAAVLAVVYLAGPTLGPKGLLPVMVAAGFGLSTQYVFPYSTVPDTVEYDYDQTGVRREGIYYGIWNFAVKVGQAGAGALIGQVLALSGYVAGTEQSGEALLGIRLLLGPIPMAFYLAGAAFLAMYPLSRDRYEALMGRIREREAREGAGEPTRA